MMYKLPSRLCRFAVMTFEEYLRGKKIDGIAFQKGDPSLWKEWSLLFDEVSVVSFTARKLYLINPLRRQYLLKELPSSQQQAGAPETSKPVIKKPVFKPKIN